MAIHQSSFEMEKWMHFECAGSFQKRARKIAVIIKLMNDHPEQSGVFTGCLFAQISKLPASKPTAELFTTYAAVACAQPNRGRQVEQLQTSGLALYWWGARMEHDGERLPWELAEPSSQFPRTNQCGRTATF